MLSCHQATVLTDKILRLCKCNAFMSSSNSIDRQNTKAM